MNKNRHYIHEADRLQTMAQATSFAEVRDELLRLARQYQALAQRFESPGALVSQPEGD